MWNAIGRNLKSAILISITLLVIGIGINLYQGGWDRTIEDLEGFPELFVIAPLVIFALLVMNDVRSWAFNLGSRSADRAMDKATVTAAKLTKSGEKKYAKLLKKAAFSKVDAKKLRTTISLPSKAMVDEMHQSAKDVFIPTFMYRKGLPGDNQVTARHSDIYTCARLEGYNLCFYDCEKSSYNDKKKVGARIGEIPLGSILGLRVIDLCDDRVARKIGGFIADRMVNSFTRTVVGVRANKTVVDAALLCLSYVNADGVVMDAEFMFPSDCTIGDVARKTLYNLSYGLDAGRVAESDLSGLMNWVGLNDDMESDAYGEFADALQEGVFDAAFALKWVGLLSGSDKAVGTAKTSADMIAALVLSPVMVRQMMTDTDIASEQSSEEDAALESIVRPLNAKVTRKALSEKRVSTTPATNKTKPAVAKKSTSIDPERRAYLKQKYRSETALPQDISGRGEYFDWREFVISLLLCFFVGVPQIFRGHILKFFHSIILYLWPLVLVNIIGPNDENLMDSVGVFYQPYALMLTIYIPSVYAYNSGLGMLRYGDIDDYYRNWFLKLLEVLMIGCSLGIFYWSLGV